MPTDLNAYTDALNDPDSGAVRMACCREVSGAFASCGDVLWAFGLPETAYRRSVAIVAQMAGALGRGAVAMLESGNHYAAAALIRQLVETEYLLFLFADDADEANTWLASAPNDLRRRYAPAAMRKRSAGRFHDGEYWSHCEIGGHPHPKGSFLLPEHLARSEPITSSRNGAWLWVDHGQHLERGWGFFQAALAREGLSDVGMVASTFPKITDALMQWHRADPCADRLPSWLIEGEGETAG